MYFRVRIGIDQSQLKTIQLLLVVVEQSDLEPFGTDGHIDRGNLYALGRTAYYIAYAGNLNAGHVLTGNIGGELYAFKILTDHTQQAGGGKTFETAAGNIGKPGKVYTGSTFSTDVQ